MSFNKANQKFNASLTSDYTVGDGNLGVNALPANTPTIVTVARGTTKETRFIVTGTSTGLLTGVTRLDGANVNISAGVSVECMIDVDFINQLSTAVYTQAGLKGLVYAADGEATDDYKITLPVAPSTLADITGLPITFKANNINTGACTLKVNTLDAKAIKKNVSDDLEDGEIQVGQIITVVYDGTNFQLQSTPINTLTNSLARQAIINGNFDVWQRGTTVTNPANSVFITDRWKINTAADGGTPPTLIHSQQILTPGDIANAYYFYRINPNGAGSSFGVNSATYIQQNIENGTRLLAGLNKKVTISFWARSSIANKRLGFSLFQTYGTGGSPSALEAITGDVVTLTSTWTKYTFTFTLNTLVGKTFGTANDDYISLLLWGQWGTTVGNTYLKASVTAESYVGSGNIDIAQVQLCAGDVALPFMPKSDEEERRACKRFCFQIDGLVDSFPTSNQTTTSAFASVAFPTEMRAAPTLSTSTITSTNFQVVANNNAYNVSNMAISNPTTKGCSIQITNATATAGSAGFLRIAASNYLRFESEL